MAGQEFEITIIEALKDVAEKLDIEEQLFTIAQSFNNLTGKVLKKQD